MAFQKLKDLLALAPALRYYDVTLPVVIQCDASQSGLGADILQDGRVVEYCSRALFDTEKYSYIQIERELLAIVFSMNRFHSYVYSRKVVVETDHKPLISITKKSWTTAPKRFQRMLLQLQRYKMDVIYRPGTRLLATRYPAPSLLTC